MTKLKTSAMRTYIDSYNDLPADVLLGRIVLFTITDEKILRDDLATQFASLELDESLLPAANKAVDAFKRATSYTKESFPLSKGREGTLMCREVSSNDDFIRRQITLEIRNAQKRKLDYAKAEAITVDFHRVRDPDNQKSARLEIQVNHTKLGEELPFVKGVARAIKARYDDNLSYLDSQKVRGMVRGYLHKLNAIEIKGGVYFVHVSRDDELSRLAELVGGLGGGCMMHTIPLVDLPRERAFMARTFEREAAETLSNLAKEVKEITDNRGSVSPATYNRLKGRFDQLMANAEEHMLTLAISQDSTSASAEVALDALTELADRMMSS
jgi:hypothetical protein